MVDLASISANAKHEVLHIFLRHRRDALRAELYRTTRQSQVHFRTEDPAVASEAGTFKARLYKEKQLPLAGLTGYEAVI